MPTFKTIHTTYGLTRMSAATISLPIYAREPNSFRGWDELHLQFINTIRYQKKMGSEIFNRAGTAQINACGDMSSDVGDSAQEAQSLHVVG